jgi:hypothetical protein
LLLIVASIFSISCTSPKGKSITLRSRPSLIKDTFIYCQLNSPWISNCLYFYGFDSISNVGFFEKRMEADDGQYWFGKGKFKKGKKRILVYSYSLIRTYNGVPKDTMIIPDLDYVFLKDTLIEVGKRQEGNILFVRRPFN